MSRPRDRVKALDGQAHLCDVPKQVHYVCYKNNYQKGSELSAASIIKGVIRMHTYEAEKGYYKSLGKDYYLDIAPIYATFGSVMNNGREIDPLYTFPQDDSDNNKKTSTADPVFPGGGQLIFASAPADAQFVITEDNINEIKELTAGFIAKLPADIVYSGKVADILPSQKRGRTAFSFTRGITGNYCDDADYRYNKNSIGMQITGLTSEELTALAMELAKKYDQESVMIVDRTITEFRVGYVYDKSDKAVVQRQKSRQRRLAEDEEWFKQQRQKEEKEKAAAARFSACIKKKIRFWQRRRFFKMEEMVMRSIHQGGNDFYNELHAKLEEKKLADPDRYIDFILSFKTCRYPTEVRANIENNEYTEF